MNFFENAPLQPIFIQTNLGTYFWEETLQTLPPF